jgi:hypothetical protein
MDSKTGSPRPIGPRHVLQTSSRWIASVNDSYKSDTYLSVQFRRFRVTLPRPIWFSGLAAVPVDVGALPVSNITMGKGGRGMVRVAGTLQRQSNLKPQTAESAKGTFRLRRRRRHKAQTAWRGGRCRSAAQSRKGQGARSNAAQTSDSCVFIHCVTATTMRPP